MALPKVGGHLIDPEDSRYWSYDLIKQGSSSSQSVDLRRFSSEVHHQRQTSSCVANATVKALEIRERKFKHDNGQEMSHTDISRLHLYYLCREMVSPPKTNEDSGTHISLACHVLKTFGLCPESAWPFDLSKINQPPSWQAMRLAYTRKIGASSYYRIKSGGQSRVEDCIDALHQGHPVVFGTSVDAQWNNYKGKRILTMAKDPIRGRHATVLVGWDATQGVFIGENSWGTSWGESGCYFMSPDVIRHRDSRDFWVIKGHWEG